MCTNVHIPSALQVDVDPFLHMISAADIVFVSGLVVDEIETGEVKIFEVSFVLVSFFQKVSWG